MNECEICGIETECARHEVFFGTANRRLSIKWGMTAWLCPAHHNMTNDGVHFNRDNDLILKRRYQAHFELMYSHELFVAIFGRNYL